ncbi:hypothetical protein ES288_A01G074500v1, partial [Gossypium darwinii]
RFARIVVVIDIDKPLRLWNVQGAANPKFNRILKDFLNFHKSNIMILMETRISGYNVDKVIKKIDFKYTFRVEAYDFSSGIWVL